MLWMVLFITNIRLVQNRMQKNCLFKLALYHLYNLHLQLGGDGPGCAVVWPMRALVYVWGVMLHTEYSAFLATWAAEEQRAYDPSTCSCALCTTPPPGMFPAQEYWDILQRMGIPTCLCPVCQARPIRVSRPIPGPLLTRPEVERPVRVAREQDHQLPNPSTSAQPTHLRGRPTNKKGRRLLPKSTTTEVRKLDYPLPSGPYSYSVSSRSKDGFKLKIKKVLKPFIATRLPEESDEDSSD